MDFSKAMGSITGVTNLLTGQSTVLSGDYPLWTFSTSNASYSASDNGFTYKISRDSLMMQWNLGDRFKVLVEAKPDTSNGGIDLSINVTNLSTSTIDTVYFPYIAGFTTLSNSSKSDSLAVPSRDGLVIPDFQGALRQTQTTRWSYTGSLSMQFFLIYDSSVGGIYDSAQDPASTYKALEIQDFTFASHAFKLYWALYPSEISSGNQFTMGYSVSIASFQGASWEDGAVLYRSWALKQQYVSQGTLLDRTDIPDWFKDIGLVWGTGPAGYTENPTRKVVPSFPNQTVLFDDWGWNLYGFDSGYGNYFPPLPSAGGASALVNYTEAVHQQGDQSILFFSATLVADNSSTNPSFPSEEQYMIVSQGGRLYTNIEPNGALMTEPDPTSAFWMNQMVNYSETAVGVYGADGVYLDGLALAPVELNYANPNNVTLSGSAFWEAYAGILENMTSAMKKYIPDPIITAEGENEVYVPYLSSFWDNMDQDNPANTGIPGAIETPMLSFVYHEYSLTYASPYAYEYGGAGSVGGSPQLFRYTLSKALAFGLVLEPNSYITILPNDSKFLVQAVLLESKFLGYLRFGQMLPSPEVHVANTTNSFGSSVTQTVPTISEGLFQSENGSEMLVVSNPTTQNQNFSLQFYNGEFGPGEEIQSVSVCNTSSPQTCLQTNNNDTVPLEIGSESDLTFRVTPSLVSVNVTTTSTSSAPRTTASMTSSASTSSSPQTAYANYLVPIIGAALIAAGAIAYLRRRGGR
jgi:hypothetical protein